MDFTGFLFIQKKIMMVNNEGLLLRKLLKFYQFNKQTNKEYFCFSDRKAENELLQ